MLPKMGRKLPEWKGALAGPETYAAVIANLLKKEHGTSHRAIKDLMYLTNASERTVKYWLSGKNGPSAVFLLRIITVSPMVRAFMLGIIEDSILGPTSYLENRTVRDSFIQEINVGALKSQNSTTNVPINDQLNGHINDLINTGMNERQAWFFDRVESGEIALTKDIVAFWHVCFKTARRDIDGLRSSGRIKFEGSRRNGRYISPHDNCHQLR